MRELLAKILAASKEQKCPMAKVYAAMSPALDELETTLDQIYLGTDISSFNSALNEIESIIEELTNLLDEFELNELNRIRINILKDYRECLEVGRFYGLINPDGRSYTADYAEFKGQRFELPTRQEILSRLKPAHLDSYLQMEKKGLKPKLQITPIAFEISTLVEKLNNKKMLLESVNGQKIDTLEIQGELHYDPVSIEAVNNGDSIKVEGWKSKSDWIKENNGFLIDIVPAYQQAVTFPAKQKGQDEEISNAAFAALSFADIKKADYKAMSYESFLLSFMAAIKDGAVVEEDANGYLFFLDSTFSDGRKLGGFFVHRGVVLYSSALMGSDLKGGIDKLIPRSVRVK